MINKLVLTDKTVTSNAILEREKQAEIDKRNKETTLSRGPNRTFADAQLKSSVQGNMVKLKNNHAINALTYPQNVGWSKEELQMPEDTNSQQIINLIVRAFLAIAGVDPKDPPSIGVIRG